MKRFIVSVVIVFAMLSAADAQQACRLHSRHDMAGVIGSTIGALVGSTVGDSYGRTVATVAGGMLGGVLGHSLAPRRPTSAPSHPMVKKLGEHRNRIIEAAVSGNIPMPRKAIPVRPRQKHAPITTPAENYHQECLLSS